MAHANAVTVTIDKRYSEYEPFVQRLTKLCNVRIGLEARRQKIDEALLTNAFDIGACLTEAKAFAAEAQKAVPTGDVAHALTAYEAFKKIAETLGYGESTAIKYIAIHGSYRLQDLRKLGCLHGEAFTTLYVLSQLDETSLAEMQKAGSLLPSNTKPVTRSKAESVLKAQQERIGAEIEEENRQREANHAKAAEIAAAANAATEAANKKGPGTTARFNAEGMTKFDAPAPAEPQTDAPPDVPAPFTQLPIVYLDFAVESNALKAEVASTIQSVMAVTIEKLRNELPEIQGFRWEISLKKIAAAATKAA